MRHPSEATDSPDLETVLEALDDETCRAIIRYLDGPMTASEVSNNCDIPMSTTYRKLDKLNEAKLLTEGTRIRSDGHHASRYEVAFEAVRVDRTDANDLDIVIERPKRTTDERLASLWDEVRREA
jgi:DNA-binding transcriptional ArsR family regulator